jgi:hypothetical protein
MLHLDEYPMEAVRILMKDKTDTELLETMVTCLTDEEGQIIKKLQDIYFNQDGLLIPANMAIVASIVGVIKERIDARLIEEDKIGDEDA